MDPQLSGFALGLLLGAAKIGAIGTIAFAIAWWRTSRKLRRLEAALPEPGLLEERLAGLERNTDYMGARIAELGELQNQLLRHLVAPRLPEPSRPEDDEMRTPRTPH